MAAAAAMAPLKEARVLGPLDYYYQKNYTESEWKSKKQKFEYRQLTVQDLYPQTQPAKGFTSLPKMIEFPKLRAMTPPANTLAMSSSSKALSHISPAESGSPARRSTWEGGQKP